MHFRSGGGANLARRDVPGCSSFPRPLSCATGSLPSNERIAHSPNRESGKRVQSYKSRLTRERKKLEHFKENRPCSLKQLELEKELKSQSPALEVTVSQARQEFESTQSGQHGAREARLGIGQEYHPFDHKTGVAKEAAKVQSGFNVHFDTLD